MNLPEGYQQKFKVNPKVEHEFQALGLELQEIYGKKSWSLFYKYELNKVRAAYDIAKKRDILTYRYLVGIIKKL